MPFLPEAVESVRRQTFRDFEVIVQDGGSSDGGLDYLKRCSDLPGWSMVSEHDHGIGDAFNRALGRSRGEIVGSIDSDNVLAPDALRQVVEFYVARPEIAAAYAGSDLLDANGKLLYSWTPAPFELMRLLECELVPPFAVSFFSRAVCGQALCFDETLSTCADFDLWVRLSHLPIARIEAILGGTRVSDASMTRNAGSYDRFLADKSTVLERYFGSLESSQLVRAMRTRALAGLHLWAAESVYDIAGGRTVQFERYLKEATSLDPGSSRAAKLSALPEMRASVACEEGRPDVTSTLPESRRRFRSIGRTLSLRWRR